MATVPVAPRPAILPARGAARVKQVLSGDTVILLGKGATPNGRAPEVVFTLENVSAPRCVARASILTEGYCGKLIPHFLSFMNFF